MIYNSANKIICFAINTIVVMLISTQLYAQTYSVSGKITDEGGLALPGVSIFLKGTRISTTSNGDGTYKINTTKDNFVVTYSFLGYETQDQRILKSGVLNVVLKERKTDLEEIVVTALNIKREQRTLGYSAQTIDSLALTTAPSTNWINSLEGKVAGLTINSVAGAMGSSEIILRGEKSLSMGSSAALIVVDGIPLSNSVPSQAGNAYNSVDSPMDIGTSTGDINPEDIASVTILKGAASTALYGSRGANGAVVIITKSGSAKKGLGITINSNTDFSNINRWPDYQNEYGAGYDSDIKHYSYGVSNQLSTSGAAGAWGPKFDPNVLYYQYDPVTQRQGAQPTPWIAYPDSKKDFFRTGLTTNNSISIDGGSELTKGRFSIANLQNNYILENVSNQKTTVNFSLDQQISKSMKLVTKINYYRSTADNLPVLGFNARSSSFFLTHTAPNVNIDWYKDYWWINNNGIRQTDISQNKPFNSNIDNPYFVLYESLNKATRDGAFGNVSYSYKINPFLNFTARAGINMYNDITANIQPKSSRSWINGFYREQNNISYEFNTDFLINYKRPINKDITVSTSLGGNAMQTSFNRTIAYLDRLLIPGEYTLINGVDRAIMRGYKEQKAVYSLYAFANFSYKNYLFLELTGRNDKSSALSTDYNSYFYPSANLSFVLTDYLKTRSKVLSFAKLRLSYAEVGSDTNPYRIDKYYTSSDFTGSITNPTNLPNRELKPERTKSFETGFEARFLKNRIGFDATYYLSNSIDQILRVPVDPASGYYNFFENAGTVQNKGIELQLWTKILESKKGLNWRVNLNASANRGKIKALNNRIEAISLYALEPVSLLAVEGGAIGDIWGPGYARNPEGKIIYENGLPVIDTENPKLLGSAVPKFKGGIGNDFTYKGWKLNVLFDGEFGHKKYSLTNSSLMVNGMVKATIPGREEGGIIGNGVVLASDGSWTENTTPVKPSAYFLAHYARENGESNMFDASYIKLRELRIDKTINNKSVKKFGLNGVTLGLYGRNLFVLTNWPGFDPQSSTFHNGTIVQGIEIGQMPTTRNFGANIRLIL